MLYEDEYVRLAHRAGDKVVFYKRKEKHWPRVEMITESFDRVVASLGPIDPKAHKILLDLRDGPFRSDPEFEETMLKNTPRMMGAFGVVAVLVKTAVGRLQMSRIGRERHVDLHVFDDEEAALAYLRGH